jgi:hypothetical protein
LEFDKYYKVSYNLAMAVCISAREHCKVDSARMEKGGMPSESFLAVSGFARKLKSIKEE